MKYRSEIDGLRAVAVLPVILFHAGFTLLSGGYLGVDVFFVISGYLITSIIVEEVNQQKFSIITFYERRFRRILPALIAMVLATTIAVMIMTTSPFQLESLGKSIVSVMAFASNIWFWTQSGYFGTASETSPLLHTWSLAVEEQYYLVFPFLVVICAKLHKRALMLSILVIFVISMLIAEWGWRNSPIGNFFLIPSRAWELMAGSLCALLISKPFVENMSLAGKHILSAIGLTAVVISYFTFDATTNHPGLITLIPVTGTVLIILFATQNGLTGRLLTLKPMVFVGLISYSLYLWHQPILAIAKTLTSIHLAPILASILIIVIFFVSYLSWKFVEQPFRNKRAFDKASIFKLSGVAIGSTLAIGCLLIFNLTLQRMIVPEHMKRFDALVLAHSDHTNQKMVNENCRIWSNAFNEDFVSRFESCAEQHGPAVFVIGGSHGMDMHNAVAMNLNYPFVASVSRGRCRAHDEIDQAFRKRECQYEDFVSFITTHKTDIGLIIYTQTPDRLMSSPMHEATIEDVSTRAIDQVVAYMNKIEHNFEGPTVMLGMLPPLSRSPIDFDHAKPLEEEATKYVSESAIALTAHIDGLFEERFADSKVFYIKKTEAFSLKLPEDVVNKGTLLYSDFRHLSVAGEKEFGKRFTSYMALREEKALRFFFE